MQKNGSYKRVIEELSLLDQYGRILFRSYKASCGLISQNLRLTGLKRNAFSEIVEINLVLK